MKRILNIFLKEIKIRFRYRITWINLSLAPFFILAPLVFTAKGINPDLEGMVLVGTIIWYWLNQYFFGVGNAFSEERHEGTMVSIILSPIKILEFLIGKGLWILINCLYITLVTMLMFCLLGVKSGFSFRMFFLYTINGIYTFAFSIFFSALVLIFRNLTSWNATIQEGIGVLSGMTANVSRYPKLIRGVSYLLPLTYQIKIGRQILSNVAFTKIIPSILILSIISIVYTLVGIIALNRAEIMIRKRGGWGAW